MNKWQEVVKRVSKAHPGKSLKEILPIAKAEYRKMKPACEPSTKKNKKRGTKGTRGLKKKRRGSRKMRGGGGSCSSQDNDATGGLGTTNTNTEPVASSDEETLGGPASFTASTSLAGGSHCGSHKKMAKSRKRKAKSRRRKSKSGRRRRRRMNGGNVGCPGACASL